MKTITQIKKIPLNKRTVQEEYELAKHEKRQPQCVYCKKPLTIAIKTTDIIWCWDEIEGKYLPTEPYGKDDSFPYCVDCKTEDHRFTDFDLEYGCLH